MFSCYSLKNVDFFPLSSVKKLGDNFLSFCNNLKNIDLSPLSNLKEIGMNIFENCVSLQKIKILPNQKILFKHNKRLQPKLEINAEWLNTPEGKIWVENTIHQSNNIQDSDILFDIIDFL